MLNNPYCCWEKENQKISEKHQINRTDLIGSKYQTKNKIKRKIDNSFKKATINASHGKSKMEYFLEMKAEWQPRKRAKYMGILTRKQASTIFKARTRMIKVKGNYKNGYANLTCRACKQDELNKKHILEICPIIHIDDSIKVTQTELFREDTDTLRIISEKITTIIDKLETIQ